MVNKQILLTADGLRNFEEELERLKTVTRKEVAEKIKVALSFGDLSENAEYDEAKNEQAQVESRIAELEAMLKNVVLIDEDDLSTEAVRVGTKVKVYFVDQKLEEEFSIVGSTEADPDIGCISDESPIGRALIGTSVGSFVDAETPGGTIRLEVMEISK